MIFSKSPKETFHCTEDRFRGHFKLWRKVKALSFQIHNLANNVKLKHNKLETNTLKFYLFMSSSND